MSALTIGQPCPAPYRTMIFCDESSQTERFFVLGALYFRCPTGVDYSALVAAKERKLADLKARHGLHASVKWEKVPPAQQKNKLDGYKSLLREFVAARSLRFKCMVVDTRRYPLDNRERWRGDPLVGYLKFYCVFLSNGIMSLYPGQFYNITMDDYTFREGDDSDALRSSVEGRYTTKTRKSKFYRHCDLNTANEQDSNLLQLTDVLTGAVAFCWNGGKERTSARSSNRKELVEILEAAFEMKLEKPNASRDRFGIWQFRADS